MKKKGLFIALIMMNFLSAQKVIKKSMVVPNASFIKIDLKNCFELSLETSKANKIEIEATIDGEYSKDLFLNVTEENAIVWISTAFQPDFKNPNDKLSAHKVISITLKVKVPEYKDVEVIGGSCNVLVNGKYKNIDVLLADGKCELNNVSEIAFVTTKGGDINLNSYKAKIMATSKYGTVHKEDIPLGNNYFKLITTTGNIHLKKTE